MLVDASLAGSLSGFGAVLRDHAGLFIAAYGGHLFRDKDPYLTEAMTTLKEALSWIKSHNINNIIVESDCFNLCNNFYSACRDSSYVGLIIKHCGVIAREIGNIFVRHVRSLAKHVCNSRATVSSSVL